MDFSIPANLPIELQNRLNELIQDYKEENLTRKGYETKRLQILEQYGIRKTAYQYQSKNGRNSTIKSSSTLRMSPANGNNNNNKNKKDTIYLPGRNQSLYIKNTNISVATQNNNSLNDLSSAIYSPPINTRDSISDMQKSIYRVTTMSSNSSRRHKRKSSTFQLSLPFNSSSHTTSPSLSSSHSNSSHPVDSSCSSKKKIYDPMFPLLPRPIENENESMPNANTPNSNNKTNPVASFGSLPVILRGRFENNNDENAMISLNSKGKETFISWDKLYLRAEKVANELNNSKNKLYKMDKILLWYNKDEIIEFAVAILGCFIAGMVAVPISFETYSLGEIIEIIKLTNSKFILISNECYKQLDNLHSTQNNTKIKLIKNDFFQQINFLKTDDLGTYSKAKKSSPVYDIPNISYIEFTRTPLGRLSGVVMKHKTLITQFQILSKIIDSRAMLHWKKKNHIMRPYDKKPAHRTSSTYTLQNERFIVLNTLDPTRSTGLIFGILFNIFTGNLLISVDTKLIETPGGYESLISTYRADILLNDQLQLKQVAINYLENPELSIAKKKRKIDFSCIKACLTSCNTIDTEVTEMVVHKWLKNLGCLDATLCYSPMLTLLDFGGIFISTRDQLGNLQNFPIHNSKLQLQDQLFVNKEKLKSNIVESSITAMINSSSSFKDYSKFETFGFPIPGTMLCVVNPDDNTLVSDLNVGEIWVSSKNLTDEFYQMDKVNDFVFKAKLNYSKMYSFINDSSASLNNPDEINVMREKLDTILNVCPSNTSFLRTKLMGFIHNGKIYVLSLIEDMFLQNKLIRLPNWAHTSDLNKAKKNRTSSSKHESNSTIDTINMDSDSNKDIEREDENIKPMKREVQTHYLQQITETVVRTVNTIFEVAAFELNDNKEEHFLVVVVESSLAKLTPTYGDSSLLVTSSRQKDLFEKSMNDLTDQIYRILWIFHKIQPTCILVVPKDTLPRRYCSLELANSTIEKRFLNGELDSRFVKFQFDNIILDFIPHSGYFNESIFSERLSTLRRTCLEDIHKARIADFQMNSIWQTSGIDYRDTSLDPRNPLKKLTDFKTVLEVLEWRIINNGNEFAFSDGSNSSFATINSNENNIHKKVSWKAFDLIVASFLKKIVGSKVPLKNGDRVIIMCDNSVEYVAMVMACMYCNFVIIPLPIFDENNIEEEFEFLKTIIKSYKVKRMFIDAKTHNLLENNPTVNKYYKRFKPSIPKITIFSKVKQKTGVTIRIFKTILKDKYGYKSGSKSNTNPCIIWISREYSVTRNLHVSMTHHILMNNCKILKETLQLSTDAPIFSLCSHTTGPGFIHSCLLGIYVGSTTNLFSISNVMTDPKDFLFGLQNLNVKNLYLDMKTFRIILEKAYNLIRALPYTKDGKHHSSSSSSSKNISTAVLRSDFLRNVQNLMIPFINRPQTVLVENLLKRYNNVFVSPTQINYVYQHHFNSLISLRSYLNVPPVDLYLDTVSLREGIVKEVDPAITDESEYVRIQDSGIVPVCTDVSVVNPETLLQCYDGEFGEIWCCSEGNAFNYYICDEENNKLSKDPFITEQFKSKFKKDVDDGLTYLRTGDLGFIKNVSVPDSQGDLINLNLLFLLGAINETIEVLGLTHFVVDLEKTVRLAHPSIITCIVSKAGGLLVCLVKCKDTVQDKLANITALIVTQLLNGHGVVLDLCAFVATRGSMGYSLTDWPKNRDIVMENWLSQDIEIKEQYGINYGENISIYLLSESQRND
ncbi:Cmr2p NDAI_0B04100 [Naumovozyma dairenensis CBS 421]|uniref:DMAP1-binding domain-containing protein n=1 Tax=Naumovozyma dairenensis (strain ATCC 10597 / BCRC 20456 / CBS 421 / NBRC 0211 / NRRL Y-12639) TaxID=1071378 RepID=G0W6N3_NAUDC|nr:hypothetical protein NDAI_0B04100 [Naumovozyma dairenensis CBS 421]CCD23444.1 hypothetical protein NDAI_0B04100 [Naumovozyma dairenensis CBS 421]